MTIEQMIALFKERAQKELNKAKEYENKQNWNRAAAHACKGEVWLCAAAEMESLLK